MSTPTEVLVGIGVLAVGTYAVRLIGVVMRDRIALTGEREAVLERCVAVLLLAVAVATTAYDGAEPADGPRVVGVAAGVAAALVRAPLVVVVLVAALVAGGLRQLG
ncbi:branched-subunit amino acid transport protein AzlD [Mumia flava]|uniref:Branched-subunit amino acid transport protein AzlD n=1 Tax=Mumia flava TaxID=1348852 RepID=A0A0B2B7L5_9ACTN|nr:AzlD domain-containing protein [Mumia flava]PJJ57804.1 branched-subunit amino acid transport protein AzlD [Mumia flava]